MSKVTRKEVSQLTKVLGELKMAKSVRAPRSRARRRRNRGLNVGAVPRGVYSSKTQSGFSATMLKAPSAGTAIVRRGNMVPKMVSRENSTFVCNTELFAAIATTAAFANAPNTVIPGELVWLTTIANNFSKWRWVYTRFIYIPSCATTTPGQIVISLTFDETDGQPGDLITAQQIYESVSFPVWSGYEGAALLSNFGMKPPGGAVVVDLDCDRLGGASGDAFYRFTTKVNFAALASNTDRNVYSPARINISTFGGPAIAQSAGNLFIQYCVELIEPIAPAINS